MNGPIQRKEQSGALQRQGNALANPARVQSPPAFQLKNGDQGGAIQQTGSASAKVAKLHIHADIDATEMGLSELLNGQVGHAWVSLEWNDPTAIPATVSTKHPQHAHYLQSRAGQGMFADPFGFWPYMFSAYDEALDQWAGAPDRVSYSPNPFDSYVKGQMVHPDQLHQGSVKATQSYDLTEAEAIKVMDYSASKVGADYSVYYYNCTTFAKEAVEAAGKSAPSSGYMGVCYPNRLYDSIKARHAAKKGTTTMHDAPGGPVTVNGSELGKND